MRNGWRKASRAAVAVAAAYALALHAIVAGLALGASPATAGLDSIHALCLPDAAGSDSPANAPSHAHEVGCCLTHASGAAPPPPAAPVVRVAVPSTVVMAWSPAPELPARRSLSPVGARAPPRLV